MFLELYRSKIRFVRKHYGFASVILYKLILALTSVPRVAYGFFEHLLHTDRKEGSSLAASYLQLLADLPRF